MMTPPLQGDLEEHVESLAEVVARPHLRKPRSEIIRITRLMRDKRTSFVQDVNEGIRLVSIAISILAMSIVYY